MRSLLLLAPVLIATGLPSAYSQGAKPKPTTSRPVTSRPSAPKAATLPAVPLTDEEKTIYALGLSVYRSIAGFDLSPKELDLVKQALSDAAAKKPAVDLAQWGSKIQGFASARVKSAAAGYLTKAAAEPGAVKTESGLIYKETRTGTGASPTPTDTVRVQYRGTLVDGTEFDSSYARNEPAQFGLGQVVRCWTEGVGKMKVGGKATLVCPSDLAYGDRGSPPVIPGGATLIFDIELLEIVAGGSGAPTPAPPPPS